MKQLKEKIKLLNDAHAKVCSDQYHLIELKGMPKYDQSPIKRNFTPKHHPTRFRDLFNLENQLKNDEKGLVELCEKFT